MVLKEAPLPDPPAREWTGVRDLEKIRPELEELARNAIEPNPCFETDYLIAMAQHISRPERVSVLLIRDNDDGGLRGLFPMCAEGLRSGYIRPVLSLFKTPFSTIATPLIHQQDPADTVSSFVDALASDSRSAGIVKVPSCYHDGPFAGLLEDELRSRQFSFAAAEGFERAIGETDLSFEDYFRRISKSRKKAYRRMNKTLEKAGEPSLEIVRSGEPGFQAAYRVFLDIEASGWKGKSGTALKCSAPTRAFADQAFASENGAPDVAIYTLLIDGKPVAASANCLSNGMLYTIKGGYDEAYSHCSPGVRLDYEMLEQLCRSEFSRIDSAAEAGHQVEGVWLERTRVGDFYFSTSANSSEKLDSLLKCRKLYLSMKDTVKKLAGR